MINYSPPVVITNIIKKTKPNFIPKMGIILGSGMGEFVEQIQDKTVIPYIELPKFHTCTIEGHSGNLYLGYLAGVPIICLQGRAHIYEGINFEVIKNLIRPLRLLGCEILMLTAATGSLIPGAGPGDFVLIKDHINFQGTSPLIGPNDDEFGPRFVAMENAYDPGLRQIMSKVAKQKNIKLTEGVYISTTGPNFETPAEIRAFRNMGADVVGMSTVAETIVARHCGLNVVALATITNMAAGLQKEPLSHKETLENALKASKNLAKLIFGFCEEIKNAK